MAYACLDTVEVVGHGDNHDRVVMLAEPLGLCRPGES